MSEVLNWGAALAVSIGGTSRTADLTGAGAIDRELDAAGIATLRLAHGTAKPAVGAAVLISGIVATPYVGVVSRVGYDPGARVWVVQCSDQLQEQFEALGSGVAVCALLPDGAIWHRDLHGEFNDGWEAAQDAMATIPHSIFMEGGTLHAVPWAGTGYTTTIEHAAGGIYDGSVELTEASTRERVRQLTATVQIRYPRLHHWALAVGWAYPDWDFCDWMAHPWGLPTRQMIAETAAGNAWALQEAGGWSAPSDELGINTTGLPASGVYCGQIWSVLGSASDGGFAWLNKLYDTPANMVYAASWRMGRRWAQTIEETYTLTVSATAGTVGAVLANEQASHAATADETGWDGSAATRLPTGAEWTISQGHRWSDRLVTANRTLVLQGMVQTLATRIRASQRRTTLSVAVEPGSEPGLGSRCRIVAEDLSAEGQVIQLATSWDSDSHQARCQVTLSVSGGATAGDALSAPTAPDVSPAAGGYTLASALTLGTHIGRATDCPEQDEEWDGWISNVFEGVDIDANLEGEVYDEGFVLVTPDVPDAARNDQVGTVTATYTIDPLSGTLSLT
ncbi:hypothetical protein [uncultured Lamprocystis sp.]|jgi:hypothetical protein|uniref:hypothetical protein n=1 Tax=uncultured Lamprocystis sp. TaxID=543132 RepID=UPI0025CF63E5|nr:hypothetical protein [uncultured Lamprocystis sp.]